MTPRIFALFFLFSLSAQAALVQETNRYYWIPGYSVGSQITRTNRTVSLNVTNFGADASGVTNASTAINAAIAATTATSNLVYFPAGRYRIVDQITIATANSGISLRGETNASGALLAELFGQDTGGSPTGGAVMMGIGPGQNVSVIYPITSGGTAGSTNLVMSDGYVAGGATNNNVNLLDSGYIIWVSGENGSNPEHQIISTGGYDHNAVQHCAPVGRSGSTVSISAPLAMTLGANPTATIVGLPPVSGVGIEWLKLSCTNTVSGAQSTQQNLVSFSSAKNCWMVGCETVGANNYHIVLADCVNVTVERNTVHRAPSSGPNHAALLLNASSCLIQDNQFYDGLQPVVELNGGMGNAFFANFSTNNIIDFLTHNSHPAFSLIEANSMQAVTLDGYFGSTSKHTFLRNKIYQAHIYFKRWTTFQQVIGNIIGDPEYQIVASQQMQYQTHDTVYHPVMFQFGHPNIGNDGYTGSNGPTAWNYPGNFINLFDPADTQWTNGIFKITNAPSYVTNYISTNMGLGLLTNLHAPLSAGYPIVFQNTLDTNWYYAGPWNGNVLTLSQGNVSNVALSVSLQLSNNWRVFMAGQNQYQQLQLSNRLTHTIVSNLCYTNVAGVIVNDPIGTGNGSGIVSNSFLYPAGQPTFWNTNWPPVDIWGSQKYSMIPAEQRYFGIGGGGGGGGDPGVQGTGQRDGNRGHGKKR